MSASNYHLLKTKSIRAFSKTSSKFYTIHYGSFEFSEHLLMAAFLRFRSTCFSEYLKWMLSSLSKQANFFSEYFCIKNHSKNIYFHSPFHEEREFLSLLFIMFSSLLFRSSLFKNFSSLTKLKDFDFFKATTLSTLNIKYVKLIYIKGWFWFTFE